MTGETFFGRRKGSENFENPAEFPRAQVLLVTNAYPNEGALYRNAFIHRRVLEYLNAGISVEVFYLHPPVQKEYRYAFEGVSVTVGNQASYQQHIASTKYRKYLVHFASPAMILPIRQYSPTTPVIVWIHGFEAEAWHRRWFNITNSAADIMAALDKKTSYFVGQNRFMKWLFSTTELDITVVHVSDWFRRIIAEPDAGASARKFEIIPNYIDERLFCYSPKAQDDRTKILSIRPFASRKYANDLSVQAILELSRRPYFSRLEFAIFGDGERFEAEVAPLVGFENVQIEQRFLRQDEIAALHREYGTLLTPTRFDSQGVSMCEGMASGLVPISTDIAAIPEFVDNWKTGLLAPPEDPIFLADLIETLYYSPELFAEISRRAAERIREICGSEVTTAREIELIGVDVR